MPHPRYEKQETKWPPVFCSTYFPLAASGGPPGDIAADRSATAGVSAPHFLRNLARCAAAPDGAQLTFRGVECFRSAFLWADGKQKQAKMTSARRYAPSNLFF